MEAVWPRLGQSAYRMEESSTKILEKRKVDAKSSKNEAGTLRLRDVSPLRKKPRLPFAMIKYISKKISSAKKTQAGAALLSTASVKHIVDADSKKIGGMRNIQDIPLKSPIDKLKTCNLPGKEVYSRTNSLAEKQRVVDIPPRSSNRLHQSMDEDQTGKTAPLPNHRDPAIEPRAVLKIHVSYT